MKRVSALVFLAIGSWSTPLLWAQPQDASSMKAGPQDISFEQVPLPGGYVSNFVNGVAQDQQGFLWLATRAWLLKYDGYETTTYRPNPDDSTALAPSKWVETVYVDRAGTLWVGTFGGGLDRYNPATDSFTHFPHDPDDPTSLSGDTVTVMLEDRNGTFWVGTHQGLNRMSRQTGRFTRYRHDADDPTSLSNDQVRVLYEDRQGTLWIGTGSPWGSETPSGGGGLNRFEPETETFTRYVNVPAVETSLIDNHVSALFEDSGGTFWVGTAGDGLHTMDRKQGTFRRHVYDPTDPHGLSMPQSPTNSGLAYVSFVREDDSGSLWIGAINGGLGRYEPATGRFADHNGSPGGLGTIVVQGMFESREGTLWVVTWDGLFRVVRHGNMFRHYVIDDSGDSGANSVKAVLEDRAGTLWIGTDAGGLSRIDPSEAQQRVGGLMEPARQYVHDPGDPHSLSHNTVLSLHEDPDGTLWVGTAAGLDMLDRESERFTRYQHNPGDPHSLGSGQVFSIDDDQRGRLWVGLYGGGLSRFDRDTGRFERLLHDPGNPNSLSDDDVAVVHEDRAGIFWIGTLRGGLNRFDPRTGRFKQYPYPVADSSGLSDGFITAIHEDAAGVLWIGTMLGGLNRFDRRAGRFAHFSSANSGLPDNRIQGILGDEGGNIWVSTGNGAGSDLVRFSPEQGRFYAYETGLDLPSGTEQPGSFQRRDGELLFGGDTGFIAFSPKEVVINTSPNLHPPQVVVTGLTLLDDPDPTAVDNALKALLTREDVMLSHDDNTFSIDFVGLHFKDPAGIRYSYMLEGYDETWRGVGTERTAEYYRVPAGDYVFRVKASNSDGVWGEEGALLPISILPPWWRTWWAYVIYGLLFVGGTILVDRVQRRRLRDVERRRASLREAKLRTDLAEGQTQHLETLSQARSRFFANISHEFRTPLTLVLGPVRDIIAGRIDPERFATFAPLMHRNAGRLLELINQLLDLSRLDAGAMQLDAERQDLVGFLRRHVLTFTSRVERDGVALAVAAEPDVIEMTFDADKLETIVSNLLSNAFKFTPSGGRIGVMIKVVGDHVEVAVRDTGEGIAAEDLPLVFDRFYQVNATSARRHAGTGIGLALAKDLVELHGGTIAVESERGFGSTFTVRLPLSQEDDGAVKGSDEGELQRGQQEGSALPWSRPLVDESDVGDDLPEDASEAPAGAPTILIVEDNADMRGYLRGQLAGTYQLLEAEDGAEGLRLAKGHRPDLVISDVMMPEVDGFALCEAIKSDKELGRIPVVLLTARDDEVSRIEGLRAGADDYLVKPFSVEELMTRVENLVEIRRRLRERFSDEVRLGPEGIVVTSADAAFVERVRDAVEDEMANSEFGVSRLAAELGVSERQLHRRVKETAGLTPAAYIRMMRLERAAQLLEQRAGRVSDVAYAVGFNNPKYFSRLYRQTFGHAPSEDIGEDLS